MTKKNAKRKMHVPSTQIEYRGPVSSRNIKNQDDTYEVLLRVPTDLASNSGGVISNVYDNNPNGTTDWSSFAATFSEYRVLATMLEFYPSNKSSKTTTVTKAMAAVVDRASSGTIASFAEAVNYESYQIFSLDDEFVEFGKGLKKAPVAKMTSTEESDFKTTAAPTAQWYHKLYSDNLSVSTTYGLVVQTFLVQFRGRK